MCSVKNITVTVLIVMRNLCATHNLIKFIIAYSY